jgi:hypothetical protein
MKLTYTHTCSICGAETTQAWNMRRGEEIPKPLDPVGWRDVLGEMVCSQHRVHANVYVTGYPNSLWRADVEL